MALAGGYLGWLHPLGDSLAVGRPYAAVAVGFVALLSIRAGLKLAAFGSMLLALIVCIQVALVQFWPGPPGRIMIYQKNMLYRNDNLAGLEADIRDAAPLALTLQEVSDPNTALLAALSDVLPHRVHCKLGRRGGTAIATSLTPVTGSEVCIAGLSALQVNWNERQIWLVSIHLNWPWPYDQAAQVIEVRQALEKLEGPVLMAGDFNMVRWGHSMTALMRSARVTAAGPSRGTFLGFAPVLSLPIDHAFAPNGGRVRLRGALGSDHLGFTAELEP